jgi:hypothetical protein
VKTFPDQRVMSRSRFHGVFQTDPGLPTECAIVSILNMTPVH